MSRLRLGIAAGLVGVAVVATVFAMGAAASATPAKKKCIIGWSFAASDSATFAEIRSFAVPEAKKRGCKLIMDAPNDNAVTQFNDIKTWVTSKQVTALVVLEAATTLTPVFKEAAQAGIPVFGYSQDLPYGKGGIVYNTPALGQQLSSAAIAWARKTLGANASKLQYALITYDQCGFPCSGRTNTIRRIMKQKLGVTPVVEAIGVAAPDGFKDGQTFLAAHPNLNMVLGVGDAVTTGAYQAFLKSSLPKSKLFLGGMDGDENAMQLIAKGTIYRASSGLPHSAIGKAVVDLPADYLATGKGGNVVIQPQLVQTPAEAKAYLAAQYGVK